MFFTTLKLNKEFLRTYGRGKSYVEPSVVVYIVNNRQNHNTIRIGVTTGKKIGGAVQRNRAKRLITAAWRNCCTDITATDKDIVFVARPRILKCNSIEVENSLHRIFEKSGLINKN